MSGFVDDGQSADEDSDLDDFIDYDDYGAGGEDFIARPENLKRQKKIKQKKEHRTDLEGIDVPDIIGKNYNFDNSILAFLNLMIEALSVGTSPLPLIFF